MHNKKGRNNTFLEVTIEVVFKNAITMSNKTMCNNKKYLLRSDHLM